MWYAVRWRWWCYRDIGVLVEFHRGEVFNSVRIEGGGGDGRGGGTQTDGTVFRLENCAWCIVTIFLHKDSQSSENQRSSSIPKRPADQAGPVTI